MALATPDRRHLFTRKRLTSFVTFIRGDDLYLRIAKSDWPSLRIKTGDPLPLPWPDSGTPKFRTLASEHYATAGRGGVKVRWNSPAFGAAEVSAAVPKPTVMLRPPAKASSEPEATDAADTPLVANQVEGLSLEALRALVFLEETHDAGLVGDAEYREKRERILEGLAEDAHP